MCKFKKPSLPQGATEDELREIMFNSLYSLDLNDKLEKRDNDKLSYLSWANAWENLRRHIQVLPTESSKIQRQIFLISVTLISASWFILKSLWKD